jgi:hypothetical protein
MVVWGANVPPAPLTFAAQAGAESLEILSDARSWGFDHGLRRPRPSKARVLDLS